MRLILQVLTHGAAAAGSLWILDLLLRWEQAGPGALALALACLGAVLFGVLLSHLFHEWGHYLGALLGGAPITLKPRPAPLFFDVDYERVTSREFLLLSWGGPLGNLVLVALLSARLPESSLVYLSLWSSSIAMFAYVLVLEGPITRGILAGGQPLAVLTDHFGQGGPVFKRSGLAGLVALVASMGAGTVLL